MFDVVINGNSVQGLPAYPLVMYNSSSTLFTVGFDFYDSALPYPATLLNTGSITGTVIFQFGNPNVYPAQPQILNEPFVLQYSVTYGSDIPYLPASVTINQTG